MSLGDLQYLTMLAVARLGEDAFAGEIRNVLRDIGAREVAVSTVFVTLVRLEDHGLLDSREGETPARGGRARRVFRLTRAGKAAVRETRSAIERMQKGLEAI